MTISDAELAGCESPPLTPRPSSFASWPFGWTALGTSQEISRGPITRELFGRRIVGYRTATGAAVALDARCWHLGADLGGGEVIGDCIRCPFHGWEFASDGRCTRSPASTAPTVAKQTSFATAEAGGRVFVFPSPCANHALPFFSGITHGDLTSAPPFQFRLRCPWWLVGTNGFDLQHFLIAHDRRLLDEPTIGTPHPAARRSVATFEVVGRSWRDRLTRRFSGRFVTMDVTVWAGSLVFVQAQFRPTPGESAATTTYGMVEIVPASEPAQTNESTTVRVTISVRRRLGLAHAIDPIDARARRSFVRAFLEPDTRLLDGARYHPNRLLDGDRIMREYLAWLAPVSRGLLNSEELQ